MRIRNLKVGQWVRTRWDDAGARDGVVVEKDHRDDPKPLSCKVYFPSEGLLNVYADQLVKTGAILTANVKHTGLTD